MKVKVIDTHVYQCDKKEFSDNIKSFLDTIPDSDIIAMNSVLVHGRYSSDFNYVRTIIIYKNKDRKYPTI